jgi:hypothetical protein
MRQTTMKTPVDQEIFGRELFEVPLSTIDLRAESGWLDVFEGDWVAAMEPLSADGIAELYALAEEFDECVSHTETGPGTADDEL